MYEQPKEEMLCTGNNCNVAQTFGANATPIYVQGGNKGHSGWDIGCGFGSDILAPFDMYVYSVIDKNSPMLGPEGYTQVGGIVNTELETFEFIIGHCDPAVQVGDVKKGQKIATEANHGPVFDGQLQITLAMQRAGDKRGSHRHYQKRPLYKVTSTGWGTYLNAYGYYRDSQGYYYQVVDPNNGYQGCVDWNLPLFSRSLGLFSTGYEVYLLQKALVKEGFGNFEPSGYFGLLTRSALLKYQAAKSLQQVGSVGPLTRASLNQTYKPLS